MKKVILIVFTFLNSTGFLPAQILSHFRLDTISVTIQNNLLKMPWAGGLNSPQFSEIDLNMDGLKDIFIFDRVGTSTILTGKIITLLNIGTANTPSYKHAPEFENKFPAMHDWCLLKDYNCDGKEDIFTQNNGSIFAYKNTSSGTNGLSFELVKEKIYSTYNPNNASNPGFLPLYVSSVDIPALQDVDYDGDIDILTFALGSNFVEFHQNFSKELYGSCDSLIFKLTDKCWGKFAENFNDNSITFNQTCPVLSPQPDPDRNILHAGSCLLCIDVDGDEDNDLLIGDISFTNLVLVNNGGTAASAYASSQDVSFPSYNVPVDLPIFPCGFYLDVDNDSLRDMLVSPNATNVVNNFNGVWFYKNSGTNAAPVFSLNRKNLFQDEMIEVGEGAIPVFFDYNNDGLKDLLISNYGYYQSTGTPASKITLFENTGSVNSPKFEFITNDYANLFADHGFSNMHPAFGDLDGDGDQDMILGLFDGRIHYFQNTATSGSEANFVLTQANYQNSDGVIIDVGQYSAPQLFDLDLDGKLDLILGERGGNLNYYRNTGSTSSPSFKFITDSLGKVNVTLKGFTAGYSVPLFFRESNFTHLLTGSDRGYIFQYSNISGNLAGTFTKLDSTYMDINKGIRATIAGTDLNNDGSTDLVIGNYRGGVALFYAGVGSSVKEQTKKSFNFLSVPNPCRDFLNVYISYQGEKNSSRIILHNIYGQQIMKLDNFSGSPVIDTRELIPGVYFISVEINGVSKTQKIIKY